MQTLTTAASAPGCVMARTTCGIGVVRVDGLVATRGYAFPSGHAMTSVLICGLVVALAWPWLANRIRRTIAVAAATAIAHIDGAARAYLGVYWPVDVLGGWALGSFLVTLAIATMSLLRVRAASATSKCVLADDPARSGCSGPLSGPAHCGNHNIGAQWISTGNRVEFQAESRRRLEDSPDSHGR